MNNSEGEETVIRSERWKTFLLQTSWLSNLLSEHIQTPSDGEMITADSSDHEESAYTSNSSQSETSMIKTPCNPVSVPKNYFTVKTSSSCRKDHERYIQSASSKKSLRQEAIWAVETWQASSNKTEADTAVLFHSWNAQKRYLDHLVQAFSHPNALHAVAIKTQPHLEILKRVVAWGFGLEAASIEEVHLALKAGCPPERIVFDSPVKTRAEIAFCQKHVPGIRLNVNSLEELDRLPQQPTFAVGIRVNPMADPCAPFVYYASHEESKFGVPICQREDLLHAIEVHPVVQLHLHSGSSMANLDSAVSAIESVVKLAIEANSRLALKGIDRRIESIDIGGGLLPEVLGEARSMMEGYVDAIRSTCPELWDFHLITEFGQWSYFYTGYAFSQVEYVVQRGKTRVAYVHLGADFLLRDAYVKPRGIEFEVIGKVGSHRITVPTDIAGPLCFAGDYLQKGVLLPYLEEGDGLLLLNTGSNAYALWSRHCSRTVPAIYGVDAEAGQLEMLSPRFNPFM